MNLTSPWHDFSSSGTSTDSGKSSHHDTSTISTKHSTESFSMHLPKSATLPHFKHLTKDRDKDAKSKSLPNPTNCYWKFAQCFGEREETEIKHGDLISTVEFEETGTYMATGDHAGRIVLFERDITKSSCEYKFLLEFVSHAPEFDYLKSLEIDERVNDIKWLKKVSQNHFLLSANEKTIKLWRIGETADCEILDNNFISYQRRKETDAGSDSDDDRTDVFKLPKCHPTNTGICAQEKRFYKNAHIYHIHSISPCTDNESFLSADDLRVNLWNYNDSSQSFNIVDIKPAKMEDLTEVITSAIFHPIVPSQFIYTTSKGFIRLCDMRSSALCDTASLSFQDSNAQYSPFAEILSSISDARLSPDGVSLVSRDYFYLRLWDVRKSSEPVLKISVFESLKASLKDLYEKDHVFDKFECCFSGDGQSILTGSYNNYMHSYDTKSGERQVSLLADKSIYLQKKPAVYYPSNNTVQSTGTTSRLQVLKKKVKDTSAIGNTSFGELMLGNNNTNASTSKSNGTTHKVDDNVFVTWQNFHAGKRILNAACHPLENTVAMASQNNLFIFTQARFSKHES